MKRFVVVVLSIILVLSLSVSAFAATADGIPTEEGGGGRRFLLGVYNTSDKKIAVIPTEEIGIWTIKNMNNIPWEDQEPFLKAYEETRGIKDRTVRSVFYLWIPGSYKELKDFAYVRYPFTCSGKNIKFTVNGKEMEIGDISENSYFAKLTEFGTIVITCD